MKYKIKQPTTDLCLWLRWGSFCGLTVEKRYGTQRKPHLSNILGPQTIPSVDTRIKLWLQWWETRTFITEPARKCIRQTVKVKWLAVRGKPSPGYLHQNLLNVWSEGKHDSLTLQRRHLIGILRSCKWIPEYDITVKERKENMTHWLYTDVI